MSLVAPILGIISHELLPQRIAGGPYKVLQALAIIQVEQSPLRRSSIVDTTVGAIADMIGLTYMGTRDALTSLANSGVIVWNTGSFRGSRISVNWAAAGVTWEAYLLLESCQTALGVHLSTRERRGDK